MYWNGKCIDYNGRPHDGSSCSEVSTVGHYLQITITGKKSYSHDIFYLSGLFVLQNIFYSNFHTRNQPEHSYPQNAFVFKSEVIFICWFTFQLQEFQSVTVGKNEF